VGVFDSILKDASEEDKAFLSRHPELQPTVAKLEEDFHVADESLRAWEGWKANHWDPELKTTREHAEHYRQLLSAQDRIKQLEEAGVTDMTFEQLKDQLLKDNTVAQAIVAPQIDKFSREVLAPQLNGVVNAMEGIFTKMTPIMFRHKEEFGEILDPEPLLKFMSEKKNFDVPRAYDEFVSARRTEKAAAAKTELEAQHQAELTKAREEERAKVQQELAMNATASPTDLGGAGPAMGHLERSRLAGKVKEGQPPEGPPAEARLGDGSVSGLGYRKWLEKQAAGPVQ